MLSKEEKKKFASSPLIFFFNFIYVGKKKDKKATKTCLWRQEKNI